MEVVLIVIFVLFGAAVGSFLNLCIDRLPAGKSLISQPSHCDTCQRRLRPLDMIPVVSYLALGGRCRYCQTHIPLRALWVEVFSAVLVAYLYWRYGLTVQLAVSIYYCCLFLVLAFIDLEHKLILNKVVYPSLVFAIIIDTLMPQPGLKMGAIGGATGFAFLLIAALVFRGGMGWGDIKMAVLIGLATGFPLVHVSLAMAAVLGGLIAGFLLLLKIKKRKDAIPFAPFLSLAAVATLLWGQNMFNWYLGLFQT